MAENLPQTPEITVKEPVYARYMSLFETLKKQLHVFLQTSAEGNAMEVGDIFLFNHFTRFETSLPPYLIYKKTGRIVRSVAHHSLFRVPGLGGHLRAAGAVPSNMPGLLPFLAKEILRGHKVVIFPEGGMVRDKKVLDDNGNYQIYSSSSGKMRPHHKGAAALAVTLDMLKYHLSTLIAQHKSAEISHWCAHLHLTPQALREAVAKPTLLVPGTITYYPLRTREAKWLQTLEKLFGTLPAEARDDLVIESNLILHKTDISVHFAAAQPALRNLSFADKLLINNALSSIKSVEELFTLDEETHSITRYYLKRLLQSQTEKVRAAYAHRLYEGTTVNINHVIAVLITLLAQNGVKEITHATFHKMLYLALKNLQKDTSLHLHCTLTRPSSYMNILEGTARSLQGFLKACAHAGVVEVTDHTYRFTPRLSAPVAFEEIRLQNPVQVHYNEVFPNPRVREVIEHSIHETPKTTAQALSLLRFDDELREYEGQRYRFSKKAPETLSPNTPALTGKPSLLIPATPSHTGILLVHGFGSLPSEFKELAHLLHARGHTVLTMRLPGHGTSFLDMESRLHTEWQQAVRRNYSILAALVEKVVIIGFSTGAALAFHLAAEKPEKLAGLISLAAPYKVQDGNMRLLPLVMFLRRTLGFIPAVNRALCDYPYGDAADPSTYRTMPVTALNELRLLLGSLTPQLRSVATPTLLLQGTADTTVKAASARHIFRHLGSATKELLWLAGAPHNLLREKTVPTFKEITKFIRLVSEN